VEADVIVPPDAMQKMVDAAYEHADGEKPAVVTQRYHPRGQAGPDFWWDTLGCSLFPVEPLHEARFMSLAIYEIEAFTVCRNAGYPRYRPGREGDDLFAVDHLRDPNDSYLHKYGAGSAISRYAERMAAEIARQAPAEQPAPSEPVPSYEGETQEQAATRNPTRQVPLKGSPVVLTKQGSPGAVPLTKETATKEEAEAMDAIKAYEDDLLSDLSKAVPFDSSHLSVEGVGRVLQQERIRLNLGSDIGQIAGFISVDFDPKVNPDVVADVRELPMFETDSVDEIYASHVLEHLKSDDTLVALKEWMRVLKPGGMLTVVCPDIVQTQILAKHGGTWGEYRMPIDWDYIQACAFGANLLADKIPEMHDLYGGPGHKHQSIFFGDMLQSRVVEAGFAYVHEVPSCFLRVSGIGEVMVQGRKPIKGV
jgi:SAM-dependent methyltransferase